MFILAFNPIVELAKTCTVTSGFQLQLPIPHSRGLPPVNSHIYIQWDEAISGEPRGWYLAKVGRHNLDGSLDVIYSRFVSEVICLMSTRWSHARGNSKHYLPPDMSPWQYQPKSCPLPKEKYAPSAPHKVKAYADDPTLCSKTTAEHQIA